MNSTDLLYRFALSSNSSLQTRLKTPLSTNKGRFLDGNGKYKKILFFSRFKLLKEWREDKDKCKQVIRMTRDAGYSGILMFRLFGEVNPPIDIAWALDEWIDCAKFIKSQGLVVFLSSAHQFPNPSVDSTEYARQWCQRTHDEGLDDVIAIWCCYNEPPVNGYGFGNMDDLANASKSEMQVVKSILNPAPLVTLGSFGEDLDYCNEFDFVDIHNGENDYEQVKHISGISWFQVDPKNNLGVPIFQSEPRGINGSNGNQSDVWNPTNDKDWLFGAYAMAIVSGQAICMFNGTSVDGLDLPNEIWGFNEIPKLLSLVPEDVSSWPMLLNYPGEGIVWWGKDKQGITVTAEGWTYTSPMPVKSWTIIRSSGIEVGGGELPVLESGYKSALILVEFV